MYIKDSRRKKTTEVEIYKRKQDSKKIRMHAFDQKKAIKKKKEKNYRKHAFDQESDQEK